ncbi:MAG: GTP-binding protein, partial [Candidatus Hydrogenedentales bacterium]
QGREYVLIDTAGMRRKAGIKKDVERFSVNRSLRAVKRADVCLIFVDATEGISEQDKRILGFARDNGTAMIIVWTKWDLVEDKEKKFKAFVEEIDLKIPGFKFIPYMTISNTERIRVFKVFDLVDAVAAEANKRIATAELNTFFAQLKLEQKAVHQHGGVTAKILYATQTAVKPTTFVLFVNQKKLFHFSYLRYIENRLRERYGFSGVPIQIELREGKPK